MSRKHPMQYTCDDEHGTRRFVANPIVQYLLDMGPFDMNHLAKMHRLFSAADYEQFAQLIGYSLSGFLDLSYVSDETAEEVRAILEKNEDAP